MHKPKTNSRFYVLRKLKRQLSDYLQTLRLVRSPNFRYLRFAPVGHFYSPLPDHKSIDLEAATLFDRSAKTIAGIDLNEDLQIGLCERFSGYMNEIPFGDEPSESARYYLDNPYFSYGDGISLYGMMREFQPAQIIEVGSGYSSALMLDTDDAFFDGSTRITFIEPYPERLNALLSDGDRRHKRILEQKVQQVSLEAFERLEANDILFIDSSHVMKAGSDLSYLMFSVLPVLKPGVIIHFHDVMWPFEYPRKWFQNGRAWNEAYVLRSFLMHNKAYEILFFNSWLAEHQRSVLKRFLPLMLRQPSSKITFGNSSLWIRKK